MLELLVVALGHDLLPCVRPSMRHNGLPILVELVLLHLLLVVDVFHRWLRVVICITFSVKVMVKRLF